MTNNYVFVTKKIGSVMKQYLDLLNHVLNKGEIKKDRTGVGTKSVFGWQMRFPLDRGFPLLTTKKVAWKTCLKELLWFISCL